MNDAEFKELVARIEARYAGRDAALTRSVLCWLALPYLWMGMWALIGIACCVGVVVALCVTIWEFTPLWIIAGIVLACVAVVRIYNSFALEPEADGATEFVLQPQDAPKFFQRLREMQQALRARPIRKVVLDHQLNAGVLYEWGQNWWSGRRDTLKIGLTLMQVLDAPQFESVLAHEFYHISASHTRLGNWIYRVRRMWQLQFAKMQRPADAGVDARMRTVWVWLINWFWPRFNAHAFVLSRRQEYHADQAAAAWSGPDVAGAALWRIACLHRRLGERVLPDLWRTAADVTEPIPDIVDWLTKQIHADIAPEESAVLRDRSAHTLTTPDDTHPCCADRLEALGFSHATVATLPFPAAIRVSAAATWFAEQYATTKQQVNAAWCEQARKDWNQRYRQARALEAKLARTQATGKISAQAKASPQGELPAEGVALHAIPSAVAAPLEGVTATEVLNKSGQKAGLDISLLDGLISKPLPASLVAAQSMRERHATVVQDLEWQALVSHLDLHGARATLPVLADFVERYPRDTRAACLYGEHLWTEMGDPQGADYLLRIVAREEDPYWLHACRSLAGYYVSIGDTDGVENAHQLLARYEKVQEQADKERRLVSRRDTFVPHELSPAQLQTLQQPFANAEWLEQAHLVRKQMEYWRHRKLFVLAMAGKRNWLGQFASIETKAIALFAKLEVPGKLLLVTPEGVLADLARKVRRSADALIYSRTTRT